MSARDGMAAMAWLLEHFPPWVRALEIAPARMAGDAVLFTLPLAEAVARPGFDGGPSRLCGQALAAAADTCSVLALTGLNGRYRDVATTDMTTHFLRPLTGARAELAVTALRNGRRSAATRVEAFALDAEGARGPLAATATCGFAYLAD